MKQHTNGPQYQLYLRDTQRFKDALADLRERGIAEEEIVGIRENVLDPLNRFGDIK